MKTEIETINILARLIETAEQVHGLDATLIWAAVEPQLPPADDGLNLRAITRTAIENYTGQPVLEQEQCLVHDPPCVRGSDGRFYSQARAGDICVNPVPVDPNVAPCSVCGKPLRIGEWGCISRIVEHAPSVQTAPFASYFDIALGREVTSLGDRWQAMKPEIDNATGETIRGRLDYREKMSPGDLSARNDRIHEQKMREGRQQRG